MFNETGIFDMKRIYLVLHKLTGLVFWAVIAVALSSCWSDLNHAVTVTPVASAATASRQIAHSTLPLQEVWRKQVQKTYEYAGSRSIPSSDVFIALQDTLYVVTNHPAAKDELTPLQVLALDAHTGQQRWASESMGDIHSLAASQTTLFVASTAGVSAYDASNGSKKWTSNQPPPAHESYKISFDDGALYLITDRNAHYSYAQIDPETGSVGNFQESGRVLTKIDSKYRYTEQPIDTLWVEDMRSSQTKQTVTRPRSAAPVRENDVLVVPYLKQITSVLHSATVFDLVTGQVLWECEECFASDVALDDGKMYAIRQNGALAEYDLMTGQMIGSMEFNGGSPIDPDKTLYSIAASKGYIFVYFSDTQELTALGPQK